MMNTHRLNVLLAEDDPHDAHFLRSLFERSGTGTVFHVADGQQAFEFLTGAGPYSNRERYPFPDAVLLDLGLPGMTGYDVLTRVKPAVRFPNLSVFLVTGALRPLDRIRAKAFGIQGLFEKPLSIGHVAEIVARAIQCGFGARRAAGA